MNRTKNYTQFVFELKLGIGVAINAILALMSCVVDEVICFLLFCWCIFRFLRSWKSKSHFLLFYNLLHSTRSTFAFYRKKLCIILIDCYCLSRTYSYTLQHAEYHHSHVYYIKQNITKQSFWMPYRCLNVGKCSHEWHTKQ